MSSHSELSLDVKPQPQQQQQHGYSMLLKSFGEQTEQAQAQKLEEFLGRLEEERYKINAFKRELPLCMQLLTNAMEASRQQLQSYRGSNNNNQGGGGGIITSRPVLEEFIPINKHYSSTTSEGSEKATNMSDKANWMTSAQLWSPSNDDIIKHKSTQPTPPPPKEPESNNSIGFNVINPNIGLDHINNNNNNNINHRNGGAFLPFTKERNNSSSSCPSPSPPFLALPDLSLSSADRDLENKNNMSVPETTTVISCKLDNSAETLTTPPGSVAAAANQNHRKARRCWSPDLHRRFVNALQMLGGSQVATPKQIRELMKVDGLTNDEVKSHLQKYRLHTRRPSPSPQAAGTPGHHLVVLGGIWVPPEYTTAAAGGGPATLYGVHPATHASPHYCGPQVPQEFYPAPSPQQLHHHSFHHQLHVCKATSPTHSSPNSDDRDRSESIEDGKSESASWKGGDSAGDGGERKLSAGR